MALEADKEDRLQLLGLWGLPSYRTQTPVEWTSPELTVHGSIWN